MKKVAYLILLIGLVFTACNSSNEKGWVQLFNGENLDGWKQLNGKAKYEVIEGVIVGTTVADTQNSFLVTENTYKDFVLELDLLVDNGMNSGIQFRSLSIPTFKNGRVHGYQCEVDPSKRAWSGGIYDEYRRGWLYPLTLNPNAGKAFRNNEWNHYRIECIGNSIKTWVNGIPAAYLIDDMTEEGFIALQVHSVKPGKEGKQIRWKNIKIKTTNLKASTEDSLFIVNNVQGYMSEDEKSQGWEWLWDGKTTEGWTDTGLNQFPENAWEIKNGILSLNETEGKETEQRSDIITVKQYSAFELQWKFRLSEGATSGIEYFVAPAKDTEKPAAGLRYQLQDTKHPNDTVKKHTLGSLYDLIPSRLEKAKPKPAGEWNYARIIVRPDNHVEHWLNGIKVLEYVRGDEEFEALVSTGKSIEYKEPGSAKKGHILIQDQGSQVSFCDLKIKIL